jgi:carboxyl-terminal processing protease
VVYGGGGITPDIEISSDLLTVMGVELRRKNVFFNFAVDFMIKHDRKVDKNFNVDNGIFEQFLDYAKKQDVKFTAADVDSTSSFIRNSLASEIVSKQHGELEGYKITIKMDSQLQKAVELFNKYKNLDDMFKYAATQAKPQVNDAKKSSTIKEEM